MNWLEKFVKESNRIEGILRPPTESEVDAHSYILGRNTVEVDHLKDFVSIVAPRNVLRDLVGLDVVIGNHLPPVGGPKITPMLLTILMLVNNGGDPYKTHQLYENLHPFTDGNGRSGRALWLWSMQKNGQLHYARKLGFLHNWYYQSLAEDQE